MDTGSSLSKDSRYPERSSGSDFRVGSGRGDDRDTRNGSNKPRYLESSSDNRYDSRSGGSTWHNAAGPPPVKPFGNLAPSSSDIWSKPSNDNGWRMDSNDRYDRTFSERKTAPGSQFMDSSRPQPWTGGPPIGGSSGRYPSNSVSSRYENGRF